MGGGGGRGDPRTNDARRSDRHRGPLQMTQITKNPIMGQLELATKLVTNDGRLVPAALSTTSNIVTRDAIASSVFRLGWNQPTMTLEELGGQELADALRRAQVRDTTYFGGEQHLQAQEVRSVQEGQDGGQRHPRGGVGKVGQGMG